MKSLFCRSTFKGGIHPPYRKSAASVPIRDFPLGETLVLPVRQHLGAPAAPVVAKGDRVEAGQVIAEPKGFVSVPIHSPAAGVVQAVEPRPHPITGREVAVVIEIDREAEHRIPSTPRDPETLSADDIREIVRQAGMVGLGGATFPTHVKITPPPEKKIDTLIINGCECEPYLTCDHRQMLESPEKLILGTRLLAKALGEVRVMVAVEDNKPDAIEAVRKNLLQGMELVVLPTTYPQGAEKQLIAALLGREVPPPPGLPMDVGTVVQNVSTAIAVAEAVTDGRPLISRVITVAGDGVDTPANFRVPVGTLIREVIAETGMKEGIVKAVMGGPMMGVTLPGLEFPVIKGTSGILLLTSKEAPPSKEFPCIRCARCVGVCPMNLEPTRLYRLVAAGEIEEANDWNLGDCIECGSCAYACPAGIPLVQWIKTGKDLARRKG